MGVAETDAAIGDLMQQKTPFHVMFGYFLSFLMGLIGGLVAAYVGWVYKGGSFTVLAAIGGFIGFSCLTFCVSGPAEYHIKIITSDLSPPSYARMAGCTGLSSFDVYVTVHCVRNLYSDDMFGLNSTNNHYVEIKVGRKVDDEIFKFALNTPKRTCVQMSGIFEEAFRFEISPTDDTIRFTLYDQDLVVDDVVAIRDLNITEEILDRCFPQKQTYQLVRPQLKKKPEANKNTDHLIGNINVSFTPGKNMPANAITSLKVTDPYAMQRLQKIQGYGTNGKNEEEYISNKL